MKKPWRKSLLTEIVEVLELLIEEVEDNGHYKKNSKEEVRYALRNALGIIKTLRYRRKRS